MNLMKKKKCLKIENELESLAIGGVMLSPRRFVVRRFLNV